MSHNNNNKQQGSKDKINKQKDIPSKDAKGNVKHLLESGYSDSIPFSINNSLSQSNNQQRRPSKLFLDNSTNITNNNYMNKTSPAAYAFFRNNRGLMDNSNYNTDGNYYYSNYRPSLLSTGLNNNNMVSNSCDSEFLYGNSNSIAPPNSAPVMHKDDSAYNTNIHNYNNYFVNENNTQNENLNIDNIGQRNACYDNNQQYCSSYFNNISQRSINYSPYTAASRNNIESTFNNEPNNLLNNNNMMNNSTYGNQTSDAKYQTTPSNYSYNVTKDSGSVLNDSKNIIYVNSNQRFDSIINDNIVNNNINDFGFEYEEGRGRAENWQHEETKQFILILLRYKQEFKNIRKNQGLWKIISDEMCNLGYNRSVEKCKNRWKVLVAKFKKVESKINNSISSSNVNSQNFNVNSIEYFVNSRNNNSSLSLEYYDELRSLLEGMYTISPTGIVRKVRKYNTVNSSNIKSEPNNLSTTANSNFDFNYNNNSRLMMMNSPMIMTSNNTNFKRKGSDDPNSDEYIKNFTDN